MGGVGNRCKVFLLPLPWHRIVMKPSDTDAMTDKKLSILFVCLGNICRSPMAEGLAGKRFSEAGVEAEIHSAGLGDWHADEPPDRRAVNAGWKALVDLSAHRARQIEAADFDRFDYIIGMDDENITALRELAQPQQREKIRLLLDFSQSDDSQICDPYFGGHDGFDQVLELLDTGIAGLLRHLAEKNRSQKPTR